MGLYTKGQVTEEKIAAAREAIKNLTRKTLRTLKVPDTIKNDPGLLFQHIYGNACATDLALADAGNKISKGATVAKIANALLPLAEYAERPAILSLNPTMLEQTIDMYQEGKTNHRLYPVHIEQSLIDACEIAASKLALNTLEILPTEIRQAARVGKPHQATARK